MGRRRRVASPISVPDCGRSNWTSKHPTSGKPGFGHKLSFTSALESRRSSYPPVQNVAFAGKLTRSAGALLCDWAGPPMSHYRPDTHSVTTPPVDWRRPRTPPVSTSRAGVTALNCLPAGQVLATGTKVQRRSRRSSAMRRCKSTPSGGTGLEFPRLRLMQFTSAMVSRLHVSG